jgi:hypothetical protein
MQRRGAVLRAMTPAEARRTLELLDGIAPGALATDVRTVAAFEKIDSHGVVSRPIPAEFAIDGFYFRHAHHFVYWRWLSDGDIGVVTILHERMHQMDRFRDDLGD